MRRLMDLTTNEIERLILLAEEYRRGVADDEITGYGQTKQYELEDMDEIISRLQSALT